MEEAILIRTDADHSTGYGHLMRCLSLAAELRKHDRRSVFVMSRADASARKVIARHGHDVRVTSAGDDLMAEARELRRARFPARAVVLDFSHQYVLAQAERVPEYVDSIRSAFRAVMMLDGLGGGSIAGRVPRLDVDLLIVPYVGAGPDTLVPPGIRTRLAGPKYFVASPTFHRFAGRRRRVRRVASRILITFGGTDPHRITLKALAAIEAVRDGKLDVRVVVGPGFEKTLAGRIRAAASASAHATKVIAAPASLAEHMAWSDLAISGSGLTKYELALTGTPSIQISLDDMHARINEGFVRAGSAIHLGVHDRTSVSQLAETIKAVLDDAEKRRKMSRCGQALTDGLGAERIVSRLLDFDRTRGTATRKGAAVPGRRP